MEMTIEDFLDFLDGYGIVYEDEEMVAERLNQYGVSLFDRITTAKEED